MKIRFIAIIMSCLLLQRNSYAQEGLPFPPLSTLALVKRIEPLIQNFDPLNEEDVTFLTNVDRLNSGEHRALLHALLLYNTSQIDKLFYNVLNTEILASQEVLDAHGNMQPLRVAALPRSSYVVIGQYNHNIMNLLHMITPLELPTNQENDTALFNFNSNDSVGLISLPNGTRLKELLGLSDRRVLYVYEDVVNGLQKTGIWDVIDTRHVYAVSGNVDIIERIDAQTFLIVRGSSIMIWKVPMASPLHTQNIDNPSAIIDFAVYNSNIQQVLPMTDTTFVVALESGKILLCDIAGNILNDVIDTNLKHPQIKRVNNTTIAVKAADGRVLKLWDVTLRRKAPAASEVNITEMITSFFVIDEQRIFVQRGPLYRVYSYEKNNKALTRLFQFGHPDGLANVIKVVTKITNGVAVVLYADGIIGLLAMDPTNPHFIKAYEQPNQNFSNLEYPIALLQYPSRWLLFGNSLNNDVVYERNYYFYELNTISQWIFAYIIGHAGIYQRQWTQEQKNKLIEMYMNIFGKQFETVANVPLTIGYQIWNYIQSIVPIVQPTFVPSAQPANMPKRDRDEDDDTGKGKEAMSEDEERAYEAQKRRRLGGK